MSPIAARLRYTQLQHDKSTAGRFSGMTEKMPAPIDDPHGSWSVLRRLFAERGRRHAKGYTLALLFMAVIALTTSLSAYIMKHVTNELFVERDLSKVFLIGGAVIAIFIVKGLATYGQTMTLSRVGNAIVAAIQADMFAKLLTLGMDYFAANQSSMTIARVAQNAEQARRAIELLLTRFGLDALTALGLIAVMIVMDPVMSAIALVGMPVAVFLISKFVRRARNVARQQVHSHSAVVNVLQETTTGIRVIKTYGLEPVMRARMAAAVDDVRKRANKLASLGARTGPIMEVLGGLAIGAVIIYGGWSVVERGQDPGSFFSFITALLLAYEPAKRLARFNVELASNLAGTRMMYELLDEEPTLVETAGAADLAVKNAQVQFDHVSFAYRDGEPVLRDVSFTVEPGKTLALVGPSGGGKSTIIAMVPRLFDPNEGQVLVDGQNVREATLASLRHAIAYVGQDTFLFDDTIRANIRMGLPGANDVDVEEAARLASADQFIRAFPQGYETRVGENGTQLSGGQRQRIAIARALLRDAPILLLDEATSALDTQSERDIQAALERLRRGRTTIVIAHRLSTVRGADTICVVQEGRIVEQGRHDELLAQNGIYTNLHALQFSDQAKNGPGA